MTTLALKRVVHVVAGQSPSSDEVDEFEDSGLPFLQGNAEFGPIHPVPKYRCDSAPKRAERGDILLSVRAPVGALSIADRQYGIGRGLAAIRPIHIEPRFAWWVLHAGVDQLRAGATGSTFEAITAEDIGSLIVAFPPPSEQRKIADFLDAETSRIDALIEKKRRLAGLLVEWEQASLLTELGDWRRTRSMTLRQYGTSVVTGPFGTQLQATEYVVGGIPVINPTHIQRGRLVPETDVTVPDDVAKRLARHRLQAGDLVMGRKGDVGRCGVTPMAAQGWLCGSDSIAIRTDPAKLLPQWLGLLLHIDLYRQQLAASATGAMVTGINESILLSLRLPARTRAQQAASVMSGRAIVERFEEIEGRLRRQIDLLREHRQALITAAVTGELDVATVAR